MSDISALGSSLRFWDWFGYLSTALVFVGVVGESLVELTNCVKSPGRKKIIGKASALVLILGMAGELISGFKISAITGEITATLNKEAEDARKAASEAQRSAEQEHLERVKLEQRIADRHITVEQRKKILKIIKSRPGTKIIVDAIISEGRDTVPYAREIADVFHDARWKVEYPWRLITMGTALRGILIEIQHDSSSNRELASLTERALSVLETGVTRKNIPDDPNFTSDIIVLVGGK